MNGAVMAIRPRPISVLLGATDLKASLALRSALALRNCLVTMAHDGSELVEALGRCRPEVIVLNEGEAAEFGPAIERITGQRRDAGTIPLIRVMAGDAAPESVVRIGVNAVVPLRIAPAVLYRTIVACLASAAAAQTVDNH